MSDSCLHTVLLPCTGPKILSAARGIGRYPRCLRAGARAQQWPWLAAGKQAPEMAGWPNCFFSSSPTNRPSPPRDTQRAKSPQPLQSVNFELDSPRLGAAAHEAVRVLWGVEPILEVLNFNASIPCLARTLWEASRRYKVGGWRAGRWGSRRARPAVAGRCLGYGFRLPKKAPGLLPLPPPAPCAPPLLAASRQDGSPAGAARGGVSALPQGV